jgi:nucleotide-binding universal stress UspA family protein
MIPNSYKNILVPVDFSGCSENAVIYAAEMAKLLYAKVHLYHAYHVPFYTEYYGESIKDVEEEARNNARSQMKKVEVLFELHYPNVKWESHISLDFFMDELGQIIESRKIDLIIIGTKGASGLNEYLVGSNAAKIVESVKCPVLVVPQKAIFKRPGKVLFATDFQLDNIDSIKDLTKLMGVFKPKIIVAHVSITPYALDDQIMKWYSGVILDKITYPEFEFVDLLKKKNNLTELNDYIQKNSIDVVAMSKRNKTFVKRIFTGSLTKKMTYHTDIPLLVYHSE